MANFGDEDRSRSSLAESGSDASAGQGAVFASLVASVDLDPGNPAFPTLAEAFRRGGRPQRAREIAESGLAHAPSRLAGRVALALAMLDLGDSEAASGALSMILQDIPSLPADFDERGQGGVHSTSAVARTSGLDHPEWATPLAAPSSAPLSMTARELPNELGSDEIDQAFASAEPDPDGMLDADPIVLTDDEREGFDANREIGHAAASLDQDDLLHPSKRPLFETETMASLLEVQGDRAGADEIRAHLITSDGASVTPWASNHDAEDRGRILATLDSWLDNIRREVA